MPELLAMSGSTHYSVEYAHTRDEGIIACPVAGIEQAVSLVRLHSPIEFLSVFWAATRDGAPPLLPKHTSYATNYNKVFLGGERHGVVYPAIVGHTWQAVGVFRYVINVPEGFLSDMPLGKCPWEGTELDDFYIPAENFVDRVMSPKQIIDYKTQEPPANVVLLNGLLK